MGEIAHGTLAAYTNHRCRCYPCREAMAAYQRTRRRIARKSKGGVIRHGTTTGYCYYGCRCEECRAAQREAHRRYRLEVARRLRNKRAECGTNASYSAGCRCERCRAAHAQSIRSGRHRRGECEPRQSGERFRMFYECLLANGIAKSNILDAMGCSKTVLKEERPTVSKKYYERMVFLHLGAFQSSPSFRGRCSCYTAREREVYERKREAGMSRKYLYD